MLIWGCCVQLSGPLGFGVKPLNRGIPISMGWKNKKKSGVSNSNIATVISLSGAVKKGEEGQMGSLVSSTAPPFFFSRQSRFNKLGFRPSPELGLISLLFVLSTAIGAIFSLAIISIPSMIAFKNLAVSMNKLSKVVSEEVPGTLSSLKLSGLEITELTKQLSNLRHKTGNQRTENGKRTNKSASSGSWSYPDIENGPT